MKYWESSAIVPLVVNEKSSPKVRELLAADSEIYTWWGTTVECFSAILRLEREGICGGEHLNSVVEYMAELSKSWNEIEPSDEVRKLAVRLLRVHPLRSQDSLQLAAALIASKHEPSSTEFVCLDQKLSAAAQKEGFKTIL